MTNMNNVSSIDRKSFSTLTPQAAVWSFDPSNKDRLSQLPDVLVKKILSGLEIWELPSLATSRLLSKMVRTEVADRIKRFIKSGTSLFPKAEKTPTFTQFETALRTRLKAFQKQYEKAIKAVQQKNLYKKVFQGKSLFENALKAIEIKSPQEEAADDCLTIRNLSNSISKVIDEQKERIKLLPPEYSPSESLLKIVEFSIAIRQLKKAEEVAEEIPCRVRKSSALRAIVKSLVAVGKLEKAVEIANKVPNEDEKTRLLKALPLADIVSSLIGQNELDRAVSVANKIPDSEYGLKSSVLQDIVASFIAIGNFEKAIEVAKTIPDRSRQSHPLRDIVMSLVVAGELEEAEEVANMIDDEYVKSEALKNIIQSLVDLKKFEKAMDLANMIPLELHKGLVHRDLVTALINQKEFDRAVKITNKISNETRRSILLETIQNAKKLVDSKIRK